MNRRGFLTGVVSSLVAAPAVVSAASLMPTRGIVMPSYLTATEIVNRAVWEAGLSYSVGDIVWVVDDHKVEIGLRPGDLNRVPPGIYRMLSDGLGR